MTTPGRSNGIKAPISWLLFRHACARLGMSSQTTHNVKIKLNHIIAASFHATHVNSGLFLTAVSSALLHCRPSSRGLFAGVKTIYSLSYCSHLGRPVDGGFHAFGDYRPLDLLLFLGEDLPCLADTRVKDTQPPQEKRRARPAFSFLSMRPCGGYQLAWQGKSYIKMNVTTARLDVVVWHSQTTQLWRRVSRN